MWWCWQFVIWIWMCVVHCNPLRNWSFCCFCYLCQICLEFKKTGTHTAKHSEMSCCLSAFFRSALYFLDVFMYCDFSVAIKFAIGSIISEFFVSNLHSENCLNDNNYSCLMCNKQPMTYRVLCTELYSLIVCVKALTHLYLAHSHFWHKQLVNITQYVYKYIYIYILYTLSYIFFCQFDNRGKYISQLNNNV